MLKENVHVRISSISGYPELTRNTVPLSSDVGKLISFTGQFYLFTCTTKMYYYTEIFLLLAVVIAKSMKCCRVSLPLIKSHLYKHYKDSRQPLIQLYSATSIIRTSFIQNLDYPDLLETSGYISTHAQRAWPMNLKGMWQQSNV